MFKFFEYESEECQIDELQAGVEPALDQVFRLPVVDWTGSRRCLQSSIINEAHEPLAGAPRGEQTQSAVALVFEAVALSAPG